MKDAAKLEAKSARARDETTKVEQKAKARLLEVKAVHDKAEAELRAKEEEHAVRFPFLHLLPFLFLQIADPLRGVFSVRVTVQPEAVRAAHASRRRPDAQD